MALTLDSAGNLAQLSKQLEDGKKKVKIGVYYVGPNPPAWVEKSLGHDHQ